MWWQENRGTNNNFLFNCMWQYELEARSVWCGQSSCGCFLKPTRSRYKCVHDWRDLEGGWARGGCHHFKHPSFWKTTPIISKAARGESEREPHSDQVTTKSQLLIPGWILFQGWKLKAKRMNGTSPPISRQRSKVSLRERISQSYVSRRGCVRLTLTRGALLIPSRVSGTLYRSDALFCSCR